IAKAFSPTTILAGGTSTITFTITNTNTGNALSSVAFSDTLPAGSPSGTLAITTPAAVNGCGGTLTAANGTTLISLTGASLAAGASCQITVNVRETGAGTLTFTNTTG